MKTIEDVDNWIEKRLRVIYPQIADGICKELHIGQASELERLRSEINESKIKESQMGLKQETAPTTPKPFDIDRCLNEDGGRCVWMETEYKLISKVLDWQKHAVLLNQDNKFAFFPLAELQNIPRRKEEWINVWKKWRGQTECSNIQYVSKEEALRGRNASSGYIGDPICISSEEV